MAFCENCGTQLSDAAKFCGSCGKAAGAEVASTPSTSPKRSGATMKSILAGVAFLVLLGAGAVFYFSHRGSKYITQGRPDMNAIVNALQGQGSQPPASSKPTAGLPDVNAIVKALQGQGSQSPASPKPTAGLDKNKIVTPAEGQCALFTKEELTQVLGDTFTHADATATGCTYKGDAPRQIVWTEIHWTGGRKLFKEKSDSLAFMRQSMANLHYPKAEIESHEFPVGHPYPGVGEEGWISMWNVVTGRKGDIAVSIDLRAYPGSDDNNKMLINAALARVAGSNSASAATPNQPTQ